MKFAIRVASISGTILQPIADKKVLGHSHIGTAVDSLSLEIICFSQVIPGIQSTGRNRAATTAPHLEQQQCRYDAGQHRTTLGAS
ncbi:MAG: hypothetical protein PHO83_15830 [Geobacteraceae bacterium]|nr:hypothetical protein [Geobacteraceae bacterium]